MGEIQAAEGAVPVGAVALPTIQFAAGLGNEVGPLAAGITAQNFLEPLAHLEHPRIHLVAFWIFHAKIPPETSLEELRNARPAGIGVLAFVHDLLVFDLSRDGERP